MSSKYSTKQYISAQYCNKQMSEIWCKNIQAFLRYSYFRVGIFHSQNYSAGFKHWPLYGGVEYSWGI